MAINLAPHVKSKDITELYVSHQLQDLGGVSFNIDNIYSGLPRSLGAI